MGKLNKRSGLSVLVWFVAFVVVAKSSVWAAAFACPDPPTLNCLEPIFANVLNAALAIAGVGCFIMLIAGGFKYITAGGDAKAMGSARSTIAGAAGGLILSVAIYFVLKVVLGLFGLNVQFTLPAPGP